MIKGAPATAEATATPGASATTEIQNYPASDSDPSGASDVVLLCQITGSDPASLDHCQKVAPPLHRLSELFLTPLEARLSSSYLLY